MQATIATFEHILLAITNQLPEIVTTDDGAICDTLEKITAYYNKTGKLLVWRGESNDTIFSLPDFNYMFRAWHDFHHITKQLPFDTEGEAMVATYQSQDIHAMALPAHIKHFCIALIDCEVNGQIEHYDRTGEFLVNQKTFACDYMQAKYNINLAA